MRVAFFIVDRVEFPNEERVSSRLPHFQRSKAIRSELVNLNFELALLSVFLFSELVCCGNGKLEISATLTRSLSFSFTLSTKRKRSLKSSHATLRKEIKKSSINRRSSCRFMSPEAEIRTI